MTRIDESSIEILTGLSTSASQSENPETATTRNQPIPAKRKASGPERTRMAVAMTGRERKPGR